MNPIKARYLYLTVVAIVGIGAAITLILTSKSVTKENNAYMRVINCIISKNAVGRTQGQIEECYIRVEKDLNIELKRYDK